MKIYTKTGDGGRTGLFGGKRVSKDDLLLDCYGTVDELNSILGLARTFDINKGLDVELQRIQEELFVLGADLATPLEKKSKAVFRRVRRMTPEDTERLESLIDRLEETLAPLRSFILPGGSSAAACLHLARTVCRHAERHVTAALKKKRTHSQTLRYLNRLSDLLFVMARSANAASGVTEHRWAP